jgi:hypothetical protein
VRRLEADKTMSEAKLLAQVKSFMESHSWRVLRMGRTVVPGAFSIGIPGQCDLLCLRYEKNSRGLIIWIETKKRGAQAKCTCLQNAGTRRRCTYHDQLKFQSEERIRGAQVWVVRDFDAFAQAYERHFGWLHSGDQARGQLDMLMGGGK